MGRHTKGRLIKLAAKSAEAKLDGPVPELSNLKMQFLDVPGSVYAKIVGPANGSDTGVCLRFTSVAPESEKFLRGLLEPKPPEVALVKKSAAEKRSAASA
jgi:hypothetical protein